MLPPNIYQVPIVAERRRQPTLLIFLRIPEAGLAKHTATGETNTTSDTLTLLHIAAGKGKNEKIIATGSSRKNKRKNGNTRETHRRTQRQPTGGWAPVRKLTYSSPRKAKRETAASTGRSLYLVETRCTVGPWKKRLYPERALELETWNANCPIWGVTATKNNKYNKKGRKHPLGQRARSCH